MDCLTNCVIIIPAKLCNQRNVLSHDVQLNNIGILHLHLIQEQSYSNEDNQLHFNIKIKSDKSKFKHCRRDVRKVT